MVGSTYGGEEIRQIVRAIADAEGTEPENLDVRLQNWIETDAIRQLIRHRSQAWRLEFETANHSVEVTGENSIIVDGRELRQLS